MSSGTALPVALLLLLVNAFFVAGEFSLVSARRTKIEPRAAAGSAVARTTLRAMDNVSQMIAAVQLGITVASLALGAIAEPAVSHVVEPAFEALSVPEAVLHPVSFALAMVVVTYLHVVLGEMVPKNIALAGPERAAMVLGPPMVAIVTVLKPVVVALDAVADAMVRLLRLEPASAVATTFTKEEVEALVDESREEGLLAEGEYERLSGALGFTTRPVSSVLLPLASLETVPLHSRVGDVEARCAETGYSRFPVTDDDGGLIGYLHVKDVIEPDPRGRARPVEDRWVRPFATVRPEDTLAEAMTTIQAKGAHLARVVDEAGTVLGVVTLEDVIEELVGEIRDASHAEGH
ncbi:membrane protein [Marmoricola endophyticus]|uniref:Membrane protein n=1 Tax=Marmoricola endophyticus TaxID=2040280 RepID=A0A917BVK4_9ACTN|nr:hemolysin family protein [Marmoricola endophyticus]GGF58582.1 membrane protein [Marmoricola endophyticus]